jgi:hypothetical protein
MLPELEYVRSQPEAAPVVRHGEIGALISLGQLGDPSLERLATLDHLALGRRQC